MGDRTLQQLEATLAELFPTDVTRIVEDQIVRIQKEPPVGLLSIGVLILLWSASTLYTAIIDAMNRIAGVKERRSYVKIRLMATLMAVVEATILVGSLVAIVAWSWILRKLGLSSTPAQVARHGRPLDRPVRDGPAQLRRDPLHRPRRRPALGVDHARQPLRHGRVPRRKLGFRYYIEKFTHYDKMYGSLGGVMVLMFWFWISSLVLLVAAQMNQVIEDASPLGRHYGQRNEPGIVPDLDHAEPKPLPPDADVPPIPVPGSAGSTLP